MPKRRSVQSLRTCAILRIGLDFGRICYGCENYSELNKLIETEEYLTVRSPLASWPASLLEDMYTIICQKKCSNYFLHSLVQPQVRNIIIQPGTIHYAIAFLQERCQALRSIALTGSHHMNPEHFIPVFKSFPRLVKIDLSENIIDDRAFDNIGATCQLLKILNVSGSTISDLGLKFLSRSEENIPRKCHSHLSLTDISLLQDPVSALPLRVSVSGYILRGQQLPLLPSAPLRPRLRGHGGGPRDDGLLRRRLGEGLSGVLYQDVELCTRDWRGGGPWGH